MKDNDPKENIFEEFYKYIGINHAENTAKQADEIIGKSKDLDFPEGLDIWFDGYIGDIVKKERKKKLKSKVNSIARNVAIFLIMLALGGVITTISVEAYRIRFFNIVTEITKEYTKINIEREPKEDISKNAVFKKPYFYPGYIPTGYKQSNIQSFDQLRLIHFENENRDIIEFLQTDLNPDFQVDTEGATTEEININGSKGFFVKKGDTKTLLWFTDTNTFYIMGNLDEREIITMAESLEFIK